MKDFVCCKQGKNKVDANPKPNRKGKRGDSRSDCKPKVSLLKPTGRDKFVASVFSEEHNHLMANAAHLFRSHRQVKQGKEGDD